MNLKQQRFITEFLRYGDKIIAYKAAYENPSADPEVIISSANRLLRKPEIREAIEAAQKRIRYEVEAELKAELKQELLTIQRKREILAQIANGDALIEQHTKGKNCNMCTILQRPNFNQILKAIDVDSKLAGHYKHQVNGHVNHVHVQKQEMQFSDTNKSPLSLGEGAGGEATNPERTGIFYSEIEEELHRNDVEQEQSDEKPPNPQQSSTEIVESDKKSLIPKQNETKTIREEELKELLKVGEQQTPERLKQLNLLE